jgi:signal transduction histidine kinase
MESLGQLAGDVAHDFNNLLAVILNYTVLVHRELSAGMDGGENAAFREGVLSDVAKIRLAAEGAWRLNLQLLAFSCRNVGDAHVINLNDVIGDIVDRLRHDSVGGQIHLETNLDPDLWSILADPRQMEEALVILVANAREAMPDGGSLTISTRNVVVDEAYLVGRPDLVRGRYISVHVVDTGRGMSDDVCRRAFEPLFTTKPKGEGLGLALATVYGIVTQGGGIPQITSEVGIGTTFSALLPVVDPLATTGDVLVDRRNNVTDRRFRSSERATEHNSRQADHVDP